MTTFCRHNFSQVGTLRAFMFESHLHNGCKGNAFQSNNQIILEILRIMTQEEMKKKYASLYNYMASSNEPKYMMLFGQVMNEMMDWMIKNQPQAAEMWVEKLCAIKWEQYLTKDEAAAVVASMQPKAPWSFDVWHDAMKKLALEMEREYVFNKYAMWVVMSQVYTDFGQTLAKALGAQLADIPADKLLPIIHDMALDLLLDADGAYNVRKYHLG